MFGSFSSFRSFKAFGSLVKSVETDRDRVLTNAKAKLPGPLPMTLKLREPRPRPRSASATGFGPSLLLGTGRSEHGILFELCRYVIEEFIVVQYRELPHRLFDTKLKLARDYPEHLWAEYVVVVKEERFKMASL